MTRLVRRLAGALLLSIASPATGPVAKERNSVQPPELRQALFGDLHLHAASSLDSNVVFQNTEVTPDVAYRFAKGLPVTVQGQALRREWPLDFLAVSEHAENLGAGPEARKPAGLLAGTPLAAGLATARNADERLRVIRSLPQHQTDQRVIAAAWSQVVASANRNYQPGKFTTFIAFEWTAHEMPAGEIAAATHRGVVFSGDRAPLPFARFDSKNPEHLWAYLALARRRYGDALAIVNHPSHSQGLAFSVDRHDRRELDCEYIRARRDNEPLTEIAHSRFEHDSGTALSPNDRWLDDAKVEEPLHGGTVRAALGRGLVLERQWGLNPFGLGVVGTSDNHIGLSLSPRDLAAMRKAKHPLLGHAPAGLDVTAAALTGVWSDSNTRPAIFAALRRKEAFATTGTRIKVRFFGGWDYDASSLAREDWLKHAYSAGTPMGGSLQPRGLRGAAPTFIVWAAPAPEGRPLERVQVIKLSLRDEGYREQLFDAAAQQAGRRPHLALWRDPDFDPTVSAVYYLRVLERPADSSPGNQRHRAWSSPIWYRAPITRPHCGE